MIIRSRSPVRISFGGGGTDVPPYCNENGGCVVSATISKYAYSTMIPRLDREIHIESGNFLRTLRFNSLDDIVYNNDLDLLKAVVKEMNENDKGVNIFMRSDVPPKSGLGGSAAAFSSLIGLFNHKQEKKMTNYEIAELAHRLEREELRIGGGRQDQYATVFGGINFIEFSNGSVRVSPLKMKKDHVLELEKHLLLVYTGDRPTNSGDIINDQTKSYVKNDQNVREALDKTKELAIEMRFALLKGDLYDLGELLQRAWETKKKQSSLIANTRINDIYDMAIKYGALGGKITGAGGGGFMLLLCEPNKEHLIIDNLEKSGLKPMTFNFDMEGLQTWEVNK